MRMAAMGPRPLRKMAPPLTASTKPTLTEPLAQAHSSNGASAYGATGKNGNSAAVGQTANGDKYAAANGKTYSNTGSGWDQKSGSPVKLQQIQFQRLRWAGTQRRVIGHEQWRRRMEFAGFQCSRFVKLRSRSQVIPTPSKQTQARCNFCALMKC